MLKIIIIGLIVTVVGLFALSAVAKVNKVVDSALVNGSPTSQVVDNNSNSSTVSVAISGEINHPGSYYIDPDETLGDLITLAGGVTTDADENTYNVSLVINTRTSFYIAPLLTSSGVCVDTLTEKVNVNDCESSDLTAIGMTSSQAPALITYREENGNFEALEDILNVKGIGSATFEKVKNKIRIS